MERDSGQFQFHSSCQKCGSSDAKANYDDGTAYCFSCRSYFRAEGEKLVSTKHHKAPADFIDGDVRSLPIRKITEAACARYGYRVGKAKGETVQIAPYYWEGVMVAQHLRYPDKRFGWVGDVSKLELFGQHRFKTKGGKRLVITEGEIDAMSVSQAFQNKWEVVSVPNGAGNAHKYVAMNLEFCMSYPEVVIAFDNDQPGREAAERVAMLFKPGQAKVVTWDDGIKDANDLLQAGQIKAITTAIYDAQIWRPDGIINGTELRSSMENRFDIDPRVGAYQTPYPKLNATTYGLRKGELWTFTAGSGLGKSTLVAEIAKDLLDQGLKVGYVALEENNEFSAERMMSIHLNKRLHLDREGITKEQYMEAYDLTAGNGRFFMYDHFGSLESDNLMAKIRYLALGCEVDFIVLDHISITVSGQGEEMGDERRIIDNLMTALASLTEEAQVGILIVSHLRKKGQGKAHEEGADVSPSDLRGSGSIYQLSNRVIALQRNPQDDEEKNIATMRVMKDRFTGITGTGDTLQFNEKTGRLLSVDRADIDMFCDSDDPF